MIGTPQVERTEPGGPAHSIQTHVSSWQRIRIFHSDIDGLAVVDTTAQDLMFLPDEHHIRCPGTHRRLDYSLRQHIANMLAYCILVCGWVPSQRLAHRPGLANVDSMCCEDPNHYSAQIIFVQRKRQLEIFEQAK